MAKTAQIIEERQILTLYLVSSTLTMFLSMLSLFAVPEYRVNLFRELIENIHM